MSHEDEILAKQFLQASWQSHTENYTTENKERREVTRELRIYDTIRAVAEKHPQLTKILTDLENSSIRYLQTVDALAKAKVEKESKAIIEERDRARRSAHNVCIDGLNLLSRQFRAAGLDNEWRREIGLDRELIGHWARTVGKHLVDIGMEEYKDDDPARI